MDDPIQSQTEGQEPSGRIVFEEGKSPGAILARLRREEREYHLGEEEEFYKHLQEVEERLSKKELA